ncbi:hypothetical protein J7J00_23840 [Bacillus sp. ISL-4]|uniref:hypothetical protein n=1 Tax=Bacillus sp. ISL-4 TaxID=2819125 RepID=UPI001BECC45E|nr:hypothetical protein [Bacillus sp. ISL-4]MBT2668471.1 hypothetical protein [Bacillus sp. ISL-4]MBT2672169.1 hypothetical protein [Streptomyces sp. ISL-14]
MTEKIRPSPVSGTLLRSALTFPSFSKLETDINYDVLIVGVGGVITGITQLNKGLKLH